MTLNGSPIITTPDQTGQLVPLLRLPKITSSVALGARGQGGDLKITAARLALDDGARLVAATAGQQLDNGMPSNGGDITLKIAGDVTLQNGSLNRFENPRTRRCRQYCDRCRRACFS